MMKTIRNCGAPTIPILIGIMMKLILWTIMIKTDSYKKSQDWYSIAHWTFFSCSRMEANLKKIEEGTLSANKMSLEKAEEEIKDLKSELYDFKKSNKYLEEDNKRLEKENMRLFKEMCGFRKELNLRKAGLK